MKKIMFSGIPADIDEPRLRQALECYGPITRISIVRDGDPKHPVAVVEMQITDQVAFDLTTRLTDIWHDGQHISYQIS